MEDAAKKVCMLPDSISRCPMRYAGGETCRRCGWQQEELERRKGLPLVKDENGIRRKHVGMEDAADG